jgi:hypothetical protein
MPKKLVRRWKKWKKFQKAGGRKEGNQASGD